MSRDYVKRIIEQFGMFWRQIVRLRESGELDELRKTLDKAGEQFFGLTPDFIDLLPDGELLKLSETRGELDPDKAMVLAHIFKLRADIDEHQHLDGRRRYERALDLYLAAAGVRDHALGEYQGEISDLFARLMQYETDAPLLDRILLLHERLRRFADGEDYLFHLLAAGGASPALIASGEAWYDRLLGKPDDELAAGDLPRPEVMEGLAHLRSLAPITA